METKVSDAADPNPEEPNESPLSTEADASSDERVEVTARRSLKEDMKTSEDWWAIWCGVILLCITFVASWAAPRKTEIDEDGKQSVVIQSPLKPWLAKPASWTSNALDAFYVAPSAEKKGVNTIQGILGVFVSIAVLFAIAMKVRGLCSKRFLIAFPSVFLLAMIAYVMAGQSVVKAYNLEYALWALLVGLIISNTIGTPKWMEPAVLTEFYIKTGLVILGAEVLRPSASRIARKPRTVSLT